MNTLRLRTATETDAAAILRIYGPYVENTAISFETVVPSLDEFTERMRRIMARFPYLVCESAGKTVGYAYASLHMERAAYQWGAELSAYIRQDHVGRRIGTAFAHALIALLRLQNMRIVYGGVTLPNPSSEGLLRSFGFSPVGVYHKTGYKLGRWLDVAWFEKHIGDHADEPPLPLPITRIAPEAIERVLRESEKMIATG